MKFRFNFNKTLVAGLIFISLVIVFPQFVFGQGEVILPPGINTSGFTSGIGGLQAIINYIDGLDSSNLQTIEQYNRYIDSLSKKIGELDNIIESGQLSPEELAQANQTLDRLHRDYAQAITNRDNVIPDSQNTTTQANNEIAQSWAYQCSWNGGFSISGCGMLILVWIVELTLWLTSYVLQLVTLIFNFSVDISVVKFANYADGTALPGVAAAWKIARDLANIFFIFILLYVAIKTILGEGGTQKLVTNVIIMALLVNFSAVIPRVIIDASNILALQAYKGIVGENSGDLSQKILNIGLSKSPVAVNLDQKQNLNNATQQKDPDIPSRLITAIGALIIMLTIVSIFISASVLFIYRAVVLLMTIIISPLAVMAWALPKYEGMGQQWLKKIISESIYAPAFLMLLYITLKIFENVPDSGSNDWAAKVVFFILINSMLMGCMMIAKHFGAEGSARADKWGGKAKSFLTGAAAGIAGGTLGTAGVYGLGRTAQKVMDKDWVKNLKKSAPGRLFNDFVLDKTLGRAAGGKYGTSQTYKERVEREAGRITQFKNPADQSQYLSSLSQTDRAAAWGKLSDRQKAEVLHHVDEVQAGTATTTLSTAQQQKMILSIKGDGTDTNKGLVPKTETDAWDKLQDEKDRVKSSQDIKKAREELDKVGTGQHPTMVQIKSSVDLLKGNSVNKIELDKLLHPDVISNLNGQQLKTLAKHSEFNPNTAVTTAQSTNPNITAPVGSTVRRIIEEAATDSLGLPVGTPLNPTQIDSLTGNLKSAYKYLSSPDGVMNYV